MVPAPGYSLLSLYGAIVILTIFVSEEPSLNLRALQEIRDV